MKKLLVSIIVFLLLLIPAYSLELTNVITSAVDWQTLPIPNQTGVFDFSFHVIPNTNKLDCVIGLSPTNLVTGYQDLASIIRLNDQGFVDSRRDARYQSETIYPYFKGNDYLIKFHVDIPQNIFTAYVSSNGNYSAIIATNYLFRNDQAGATNLSSIGFRTYYDNATIFGFKISPNLGVITDKSLISNFQIDDFEELHSNLVVSAKSSNQALISNTNIFVNGNDVNRSISFKTNPNISGKSVITVNIQDNGFPANNTDQLKIISGINSTVFTNGFSITTSTNAEVFLSWNEVSLKHSKYPYLIQRSLIPGNLTSELIGSTYLTNYIDSTVELNKTYYYTISWLEEWIDNLQFTPLSTNYSFIFATSPKVTILFSGDQFGFYGYNGKTYEILSRNISNNQWESVTNINFSSDQFYVIPNEFSNKPITVRELE